jgi:hypothetical protein
MELNKDYKFRDDLFDKRAEGTTVPIELLLDPYHGVCYRYTAVKFVEKDETPIMQFAFEILNPGKFTDMTLRKDNFFMTHIGVILNKILLETAGLDENGTDNTESVGEE